MRTSLPDEALIREGFARLSPQSSVEAANADLLQRHAGSPVHILAAARALLAGKGSKADAEALLFQLLTSETRNDLQVRDDVSDCPPMLCLTLVTVL